MPRHVMLAIRNDIELNKLVGHLADFAQCGVKPNIPKEIQPSNKKGGKGKLVEEDMDMQDDERHA